MIVIVAKDLHESVIEAREIMVDDFHNRMTISDVIINLARGFTDYSLAVYLKIRPDLFNYIIHQKTNRVIDTPIKKALALNPTATSVLNSLRDKIYKSHNIKYSKKEMINVLLNEYFMER